MRMCIACHEMKPKKEMLRIVKPKEGDVQADQADHDAAEKPHLPLE